MNLRLSNQKMEKEDVKQALHLLAQANYDTAILLEARFNSAQKAFAEGHISLKKWEQIQAQIKFSILNFEQW